MLETYLAELDSCQACELWHHYKVTVPPEGNPKSKIVFVGRDPGSEEIKQRRPFVGPAGQRLDKALAFCMLPRHSVYITNIVKCRPPNNIPPSRDMASICIQKFLYKELELIRPDVVVAMGNEAAGVFAAGLPGITRARGTVHVWNGMYVIPTYHPSYLARLSNLDHKLCASATMDFCWDIATALEHASDPVLARQSVTIKARLEDLRRTGATTAR